MTVPSESLDDSTPPIETRAERGAKIGRSAKIALRTCGALLVIGAAAEHPVLLESAHHAMARSSTERIVGDGIEKATGSRILIRCVTDAEMAEKFDISTEEAKQAPGVTVLDPVFRKPYAVHLKKDVCDDLAGYSRDASRRQDPDSATAGSFVTTAHEYFHHSRGVKDESVAGCYGVQQSAKLATAFGATDEQAILLRERGADTYKLPSYGAEDPRYAQYRIGWQCMRGEELDLNLLGDAFPPVGSVRTPD